MKNLNAVLGVKGDATVEQIKAAYRRLARAHHPDHAGGDGARFKEITAAYEILSDPTRRAAYERQRAAWLAARGAVACPGCGQALRVVGLATQGRVVCGSCQTAFEVQWPVQEGRGIPEAGVPTLMEMVADRLREHGQRIGNQVLLESASVAEQISDQMVVEAATLAVQGVRAGFERLRKRLQSHRGREDGRRQTGLAQGKQKG